MEKQRSWWGNVPPNGGQRDGKKKKKMLNFKYSGALVILIIMFMLVNVAVVVASVTEDPRMYKIGPERAIMYPAPVKDVLHSCGDIFLFYPEKGKYGVVPDSVLYSKDGKIPTVPTRIPSYGYMSPEPFDPPKRVYTTKDKVLPSNIQIMRGMWEGYYFAWYHPDKATPSQVNYLKGLTEKHSKLIVLPWVGMDTKMPFDRSFSFSTWNISQSCESIEEGTVESFLSLNDPKPRDRDNPPMAPLVGGKELEPMSRYSPYMFPDDVQPEKLGKVT